MFLLFLDEAVNNFIFHLHTFKFVFIVESLTDVSHFGVTWLKFDLILHYMKWL